ncbi:serine/threonine-protein kinase [Nonomuraea sp. NPDC050536]|uniref:serine/threonine-protein kinase n=1 Tax=Nonomuraea sp. NPDC050536 TaxID=3364366 RepID=UPI0037C6D3A7
MNQPRLVGGRYQLIQQIGRGGMGIVWQARDTSIGRDVAIKQVMPPQGMAAADAAALRARTLHEARTAAQIRHPAVVGVHDVVDEGGEPWIVMELVRGRSLDQVIKAGGPMSPQWAASVGLFVLSALASAHARGLLHRDVKPGNVLMADDGRILLSDFGIAAPSGAAVQPGTVPVGTPGYTPPECLTEPMRPGPYSDLFSLGATIYYAVEGAPPFQRPNAMATLGAVMTEPPRPPQRAGALAPILQGLLAKDPAHRPDTATLRQALTKLTGRPGVRTPAADWVVPKAAAYGSAAAVVVAFVAAMTLILTMGSSSATPKPTPTPVAAPKKTQSAAPSQAPTSTTPTPSVSTSTSSAPAEPGKFSKMPRPCSLLTKPQATQLIGPYLTSSLDPSFICGWGNTASGNKEMAFWVELWLYPPQGDGYETTLAQDHMTGRKKEDQDQAGRGGTGGRHGEVFEVPGAGDEAFGQEVEETGAGGKTYVVNVTFRTSNMVGELRFTKKLANDPKLRDKAAQAAKFLVQGLAGKAS